MPYPSQDDTIIAVSTPIGAGGIGIVRLSGPRALEIGLKIFKPHRPIRRIPPLRVIFGDLIGHAGSQIDEAFLTYFKAPASYTREDVVELSCHGSPAVLLEAVRSGVRAGARRAKAGEFTERAFLNGRIDILQAEAVQSLVGAESLLQARISYSQLKGGLSSKLIDFRRRIISLLAEIEARLEFPDENLAISSRRIESRLEREISFVSGLAASYETGKALCEGYSLAIVGRPNVGKSTLFNALSGKDRAIVTPFPGTTRDYLQERIRIGDAFFNLIDMAGLGETNHPVESEGVKRARRIASQADGVLLVFDLSKKLSHIDLELVRNLRRPRAVAVLNKSDLPRRAEKKTLQAAMGEIPIVEASALKAQGIDEIRRAIGSRFGPKRKRWEEVILHARQKGLLEQIGDALSKGLGLLREKRGEELCSEEIRRATTLVGQLTGDIRAEDVLRSIFDRFCVGK